jgi:hypothetical protein
MTDRSWGHGNGFVKPHAHDGVASARKGIATTVLRIDLAALVRFVPGGPLVLVPVVRSADPACLLRVPGPGAVAVPAVDSARRDPARRHVRAADHQAPVDGRNGNYLLRAAASRDAAGDASIGNVLSDSSGHPVVIDLDDFATGPRERDLIQTAIYYDRFGWHTREEYETFAKVYGYDIMQWPDYPMLADIREFIMVTWIAQKANESEKASAEARKRLDALRTERAAKTGVRSSNHAGLTGPAATAGLVGLEGMRPLLLRVVHI